MTFRSQRGEAYNNQKDFTRRCEPTNINKNIQKDTNNLLNTNKELGKQLQQTAGQLLAAGNKLMK